MHEVINLIRIAEKLVDEGGERACDRYWQCVYDNVFGMGIVGKLKESGIPFNWYDRNGTCEEDVRGFVFALSELKNRLIDIYGVGDV